MTTTTRSRTSRTLTMHRIRPGFYVRRENANTVLHVFKFAGHWYYVRRPYQVLSSQVASLYSSIYGNPAGYPTYAMAVSASQGNRAS